MKLFIFFLLGVCHYLETFAHSPPRYVPQDLYEEFTLNGAIPVFDWYLYEPVSPLDPTYFTKNTINEYMQRIQRKEAAYYGNTDIWLYESLKKYPLNGKKVGIIGSRAPFYECVVLSYGGHPITVEYNKIISEDPRISTYTLEEFNKSPLKFDVIISISSIEHDGLGRYGDPINPNGDLEFMMKAKSLLNDGGYMILAVPVGADALVWTAHRIYGKLRFPLLIQEWDLIDSFGLSDIDFKKESHDIHQPILYLTPKVTSQEKSN